MLTENRDIIDKIEAIQQHFFNYLFTKTVRDISLTVDMKDKYWDFIKSLEGQKSSIYGRRSYDIEDIYRILIPFAEFLKGVRLDVLPNLKFIIAANTPRLSLSPQEKSVRNMLVENYQHNIYSLGHIILEVYELTVVEDMKFSKNKTPLCLTIKEIKNIEADLSFIEDCQKS